MREERAIMAFGLVFWPIMILETDMCIERSYVDQGIKPMMSMLEVVSSFVTFQSDSLMNTAVRPYSYPFSRLSRWTSRLPPAEVGSSIWYIRSFLTGATPFSASGSALTVADDCMESLPLTNSGR